MSRKSGRNMVNIRELAGTFAEDKDVARRLRTDQILPSIKDGRKITLNFAGVPVATQSFIHALISEALRLEGARALELIEFKSCAPAVQSVVLTVVEYSLEALKT